MFVGVAYTASTSGGALQVSTVTYNGVALTNLRRDTNSSFSDFASELWYVLAPSTGANTVVVTYNRALATPAAEGARAAALSLTGVRQVSPEVHNGGSASSASSIATSITSVADNAWQVDVVNQYQTNAITVAGGQTEKVNLGYTSSSTTRHIGMSIKGPLTPPASTTFTWNGSAGNYFAQSVVSIAPAATVTTTPGAQPSGPTVFKQSTQISF